MKKIYFLLLALSVAFTAQSQEKKLESTILVSPYLQIGDSPSPTQLHLLWHTNNVDANWSVEFRPNKKAAWKKVTSITFNNVAAEGLEPMRVYKAIFTELEPGSIFEYKVSKNKISVFEASAHALKNSSQPYRFVAFGDCGAGTPEQKPVANTAFASNPDLVVIPGDIVYEYGLISEYKTKFWPIYNADKVSAEGAPLLRSIPFVAAPGNHDTDMRDFDKHPDALAYYLFWDQPLNGPVGKEGGPYVPALKGEEKHRQAFMNGATATFPRMANFSFNYGNAHWIVLDSNPYADWTEKELTDWVTNDLSSASAKEATWRFVTFHHPGFNSSREHYEQQHMRLLSPIFETGNVDIVFAGHVHNYQRSFPMKFMPDNKGTVLVGGRDGKTVRGRVVNGQWKLDRTFDGKADTSPDGIIYIVTGAGGQELYNPQQNSDPDSWQKFTDKFISSTHSITVADVDGKTLVIKQISPDGKELDKITIKK